MLRRAVSFLVLLLMTSHRHVGKKNTISVRRGDVISLLPASRLTDILFFIFYFLLFVSHMHSHIPGISPAPGSHTLSIYLSILGLRHPNLSSDTRRRELCEKRSKDYRRGGGGGRPRIGLKPNEKKKKKSKSLN